jgi:hypothetical protein
MGHSLYIDSVVMYKVSLGLTAVHRILLSPESDRMERWTCP